MTDSDAPDPDPAPPRTRARSPRLRRKVSGALALGVALVVVGSGYSAVAATEAPSSAASPSGSVDVRKGKQLYEQGCLTCHGANLQGVQDRGPSLVGVGQAGTYFQVITGRMPAARQEAQVRQKTPRYNEAETQQISAYVESVGGGPEVPDGNLRDGDLAEGGELFRLNCAQCHNFAGKGAPLSAGKYAPNLAGASDQVLYAAMLHGPQNMPVFSDNTITPEQKRAIVNYVQTLKATPDPGGASLGRLGPVPEGLVIWVVGIGGLMLMILWIGAKT